MLNEVSSFLNRKGKEDLLGKLILVSDDSHANGSFLIYYFLSQALKDGHVVYLMPFAQSLIHYSSIAAKLGVSLSRFQTSGQFLYVDCLSQLLGGVWAESGSELATPTTNNSSSAYTLDSDGSLQGLYSVLKSSLSCRTTHRPTCFIFDDFSNLVSLGVRTREMDSFVRYCIELISGPQSITPGYVVAMVHQEEGEGLCSRLKCHAHLHLSVNGMKTGHSKDIHGEVKAEWQDPCPTPTTSLSSKLAQFKLTDKTVRLFARGTSSSVL